MYILDTDHLSVLDRGGVGAQRLLLRLANVNPWEIVATIISEELKIIPTPEQKTQCYILCCWFTKFYLPINIVRMDERTGNIFFMAGEENIIEIYPNGRWRYIG